MTILRPQSRLKKIKNYPLFNTSSISAMNTANSNGLSGHPCLSPNSVQNSSDTSFPTLTLSFVSLYISLTLSIKIFFIPLSVTTSHNFSLFTDWLMKKKKVWGIGEKIFKDDFKRRMRLYDTLVASVLLYGVETWGWKEYEEIESLQERYIRWTLGLLDRCTPWYIVLKEVDREKMKIRTGNSMQIWGKSLEK